MLTQIEIEALLVLRMNASSESCNSHHINHCSGQIRALTAVLKGEPIHSRAQTSEVCDYVGIPHTTEDDQVVFDEEWLEDHGFVGGDLQHEKFRSW